MGVNWSMREQWVGMYDQYVLQIVIQVETSGFNLVKLLS